MPRTCTICTHSERPAIDRALVQGAPLRNIAERHGVSLGAVHRHQTDHLPTLLTKAHDAEEAAAADDLLAQLHSLQATTLSLLAKAERAGKLGTAVMAIREARGNLELLAKLTQQLDTRPTLNLLIAPEWLAVRSALYSALRPFPEAAAAASAALLALEGGDRADDR